MEVSSRGSGLAHHCGDDLQGEDSVLRKDKRKSDRGADCEGPLRRSRCLEAVSQEQYDKKKKKHGLPPEDEEAFLFPNRDGSFTDPSNYRKRVLHKLATELGLPKLTFQVIRRTIATLAQKKGTVKDLQGMMRHSGSQYYARND